MSARIFFHANPWPEGHKCSLQLSVYKEEGVQVLDICLQTGLYYEERKAATDESQSSWQSPIVWGTYHACTLEGMIPLADSVRTLSDLDGVTVQADHDKLEDEWDEDQLTFSHCYILGHDAVAGHTLKFKRHGNEMQVNWTGRIARVYSGIRTFDHTFEVEGLVPISEADEEEADEVN